MNSPGAPCRWPPASTLSMSHAAGSGWPAGHALPRTRTLLTMFILYQELGDPKQKDIYGLITEKALIGAANRRYEFVRLYLNAVTTSAQFDGPQFLGYCGNMCSESLPQFDTLNEKQFEFVKRC